MFNDIRYAFDDMAINAVSLPRGEDIGIDGRVMFAILLAVVTPLLFGLMPSLHVPGRFAGRARGRRAELVGAEVAVALVLLVGAALLIRSRATRVDPLSALRAR